MSSFMVACPHCSESIEIPDELAGSVAACPHCEGEFTAPELAAVSPPEPEPAAPEPPTPEPTKKKLSLADRQMPVTPAARTPAAAPAAAPPRRQEKPLLGVRFVPGVIGAAVTGFLGMMGWYLLIKTTNYEIGWLAWGIGALIGIGTYILAGGGSASLGVVAGVVAALAIMGGRFLALSALVDKELRVVISQTYDQERAVASQIVAMEDETQIRQIMVAWKMDRGEPTNQAPGDLQRFETDVRPYFRKLAEGKVSREEFTKGRLKEARARIPFGEMVKHSVDIWTFLWLFLGVGTAWRIASGASDREAGVA
jgi:hypothetical protein